MGTSFVSALVASYASTTFLVASAAATFTGNAGPNYSDYASQIRQSTLSQPLYDKRIPPKSDRAATAVERFGGHYSDAGTDVLLSVRFFKVQSVVAAEGKMRLKVWLRMNWVDTRLVWNATQHGDVDKVYYHCDNLAGAEDNEIWIPDLQPYNAYIGLIHTLEPGYARVTSDGSVFYSRPGTIDTMCKFSGLVAFPFDKLKCQIEFGNWGASGEQQGVQLNGVGYTFPSQEVTTGSTYQEYSINSVNASYNFYSYPCCPSEPWPIVIYHVELNRAAGFYYGVSLLPGIIVTMLSFAVFWTDTKSSDPMSYGVTIIVVNLLLNVVLVQMLPVCGELIWIDVFSIVNTIFCCLALMQSAFVIMLETHDGDHLVYEFLAVGAHELYRCVWPKKKRMKEDTVDNQLSETKHAVESIAGVFYRQKAGSTRKKEGAGSNENGVQLSSAKPIREGDVNEPSQEERMRKYVSFESLFYKIDTNGNQTVGVDECATLLSFCAIDIDPIDRDGIFKQYDLVSDNQLNRMEFCRLCSDHLWHIPSDLLEKMVDNLCATNNASKTANDNYWNDMSVRIEKRSRVVMPALYILAMIILFNLEMTDNYFNTNEPMFSGLTRNISISSHGWTLLILYLVIAAVVASLTMHVEIKVKKSTDKKKVAQKDLLIRQASLLHRGTFMDRSGKGVTNLYMPKAQEQSEAGISVVDQQHAV